MADTNSNKIITAQNEHEKRIKALPDSVKARRKEIKARAKILVLTPIRHTAFNKDIRLTRNSIREWLNQPHCCYAEKNEMLLNIEEIIKGSVYLGQKPDKHVNGVIAHVFRTKVGIVDSWIIVREFPDGNAILHSISDSQKVTIGIIKPVTTALRNAI